MRRAWLVLALVLGGCSSSAVRHGLESCEPDCPEDWPAPDADAGKGKLPIHLRDAGGDAGPDEDAGSRQDAPAGPELGSPCFLDYMPGTVCLLRSDASLTEKGCSRLPGRCEPFVDAG